MAKKEPKKTPKKSKNLHIKPTAEELEASAQKALEEAEKLKNKPKPEPKPVKADIPSGKPVEPKPEPKPLEPNYKKKFVASTQEAQILHAKNKKMNEALNKAMESPDPTDEELQTEYPDWEMMSDFEKKMARDNLKNTRRFQILEEIGKENKSLEQWQKKVDKFIDDPKTLADNSELEGREDEFKLFATKPTRRNVEFEVLVSAFLHNAAKEASPKKKGKMFETGTGGPTTKPTPKSNKISLEEARQLRKTDYNKYKEYLKAGRIASPDL